MNRFAVQGEKEEVTNGIENMKQALKVFEMQYNLYHDTFEEYAFDAIDEIDSYLFEIMVDMFKTCNASSHG